MSVAQKFSLGQIVVTRGIIDNLSPLEAIKLLDRHARCDWGELSDEDKQLNDQALEDGTRLMSAYTIQDTKVWIITEADRSSTTILLPEEY